MSQVSRKLSRKILYQKLFADCFYKNDATAFETSFFDGKFDFELDKKYIESMFQLIQEKEPFILGIIKMYAPKFEIEKMHLSYIIPIYIGITEMFFFSEEIPAKVSLNEAIEMAKIYSDTSARKIVNGVMNKVFENYESLKDKVDDISFKTTYSIFSKQ